MTRDIQSGWAALSDLDAFSARMLGAEVGDLARLEARGVPVAQIHLASLRRDVSAIVPKVQEALRAPPPPSPGSVPPPAADARVWLAPWFRTLALAQRAEGHWPALDPVSQPDEIASALEALQAAFGAAALSDAIALDGGVWIRAVVCDDGPRGMAQSVDPDDGDPTRLAVWLAGRTPWRLDRKTLRTLEEGGGALARTVLERAADLADRAQLALGKPVRVSWVLRGGRPVVARVRPIIPAWRFTDDPFRLVELLWHDEGPVAPLACDALDRALREDHDPVDVLRVRRVFARAYRRLELRHGRSGERSPTFLSASARVARTMADVASPLTAARDFSRSLDARLGSFDRDALQQMEDAELVRALRERQSVVVEAYELLDRGRKATSAVLGTLEAALGALPEDCIRGLAAIRRTRERRRFDERLAKAARRLGIQADAQTVPPATSQELAALRRELGHRRPLGLDVRCAPYGASDAALLVGMRAALDGRAEVAEAEQRQALRLLLVTARARPLGRGRAALARPLGVLLERLAVAKGRVAEGLADANLRVRRVALEIGERLCERGVLDDPEDLFFLYVSEVRDALSGEPGAYTARVRLRREADDRWRNFAAPIRLPARARPVRPSW